MSSLPNLEYVGALLYNRVLARISAVIRPQIAGAMNIAEQLFTYVPHAAVHSYEYSMLTERTSETKVALATRSLSLSVEKLNATGFSINEGCNWYDVSMAVIEVGPQLRE